MFWLFCLFLFPLVTVPQFVYGAVPQTSIQLTSCIPLSESSKDVIWIHGFCAGSMTAVQELVYDIKKKFVNAAVYMTAGREDGKKAAEQQVKADYSALLVEDDAAMWTIAFERIRPKVLILLEHQIKPNLIRMAKSKAIPIYLLNSQFTAETAKNLTEHGDVYRLLINDVTKVFAQSDQDRCGFIKAGISPEKVIAIGNTKAYNVYPKMVALQQKLNTFLTTYMTNKKHLVLMVGSIHKGELDYYLALFKQLKPQFPNLKLLLGPRFLDWKDELKQKLQATGYASAVWEDPMSCPDDMSGMLSILTQDYLEKNDIVAVCLFGKMFAMYPIADLFFLGGTFAPIGGHNLLEPSVWGNPMIVGPDIWNTKDIADELQVVGALVQVTAPEALIQKIRELLEDLPRLQDMGIRAKEWCKNEAVRVRNNIELLLQNLAENSF